MVVEDKKTREIRICVDLRKLNYESIHDPFSTLFSDEVLDQVARNQADSFTDKLLGLNLSIQGNGD